MGAEGASGGPAAAVVLAAGEGRRFGGGKLLMPYGGTTVLGAVVSALSGAGLRPIIVVAGREPGVIERSLAELPAKVVVNPAPERGMVSSLRVGAAALPADVARFLVALGDQPQVGADDVTRLVRAAARSGKGIALPAHEGKRGHPVVLAGRYREAVLALGDDETLRDLIHAHREDVVEVPFPSDVVLRDIDTRTDYEHELRRADRDG